MYSQECGTIMNTYEKFHTVVCYHHILCIYFQTCLAQRAEADSVELIQVPTEGKA